MPRTTRRAAAIPPLLKDLNQRTVLETIRAGAPISRAEISRRAGISKPTVSVALQSLLDGGLVRETAASPGRPTYGAVFFELVPEAALVLGLDLGARFLRGAICDLEGEIRARQDVELAVPSADAALDVFADLRGSLVEATGLPTELIDTVVVGVPGVIHTDGGVRLAGPLVGLEGMDVAAELGRRLGLRVTVENDVNLAALGEQWRGVARGVDDFVFLSIGTGLGAGVVVRGELQRGHHGAAGEVDFIRVGREEDIDPCAAAVSDFTAALAAGAATSLTPPYDARDVFAAARAGDAVARQVVDEEARRIALHIAPIAGVTDVALVVIGGGIGANGDLLLDPIRELLAEWLPYPPRVEVSSLGEAAVLTGALAVGLRSALDNVFVNRNRSPR
ncbi:MAG TPA: ROK family transcriptional regulator [Gaiellaceae bacterium]|jgi:predicted NBD/HSP70 family sugar kinase/DNA-binding CsgD family transcriptional regulator